MSRITCPQRLIGRLAIAPARAPVGALRTCVRKSCRRECNENLKAAPWIGTRAELSWGGWPCRTGDRTVAQLPDRRLAGAAGAVLSMVVWAPELMALPMFPEPSTRLPTGSEKVPGPSGMLELTVRVPVN